MWNKRDDDDDFVQASVNIMSVLDSFIPSFIQSAFIQCYLEVIFS